MAKKEKFPAAKRFDIADVQASKESVAVKPRVVANMIKRAKKPLLITGGMLLKDEKLVEFAAKFHERLQRPPVQASPYSKKELNRSQKHTHSIR